MPDRNDLTCLGADRRDDAVMGRLEFGIGEVIPGEIEPIGCGASLVLRRHGGCLEAIVSGLRGPSLRQELRLTALVGSAWAAWA